MASGPVLLLLLGLLTTGGILIAYSLFSLLQLRWFRRALRSDGGRPRPGSVAVEGVARTAADADSVSSPVTGTNALLYEYGVKHLTGAPASPNWRTVASGQDGVAFDVDTDAGRLRVEPPGAALELDVADEIEFEASVDALEDHPAMETLELAYDENSIVLGDLPLTPGDHYRVIERRIEPGDAVTVAGIAVESGAEGSPRSPDRPALVLRRTRSRLRRLVGLPFVIGDADGGALGVLRDRVIVGGIFGLPLAMLALVLLFPP